MSNPRLPGTMHKTTAKVMCVNALKTYLLNLPGPFMDRPGVLAKKIGLPHALCPDAWLICCGLDALASKTETWMLMRHGTRSQNRGHYAIRILSTGMVLKTIGCPFEPPEAR